MQQNKVNLISDTIISNSFKKNHLSHAYLFEIDNSNESENFVFSFVKKLLCPNNKYLENCKNCTICQRIDNDNYPELVIIEPDGLFIKKEQLVELKKKFKDKSLENNKMIYVIKNVDMMNKSSANTILKFLEEPEDNIFAILTTINVHKVIDTIVSRCQVISHKSRLKKIDEKYSEDIIKNTFDFIIHLENNHERIISDIEELWNNKFKEKDHQIMAFEIMIYIYMDVINMLLKNNIEYFNNFENSIKSIANFNTLFSLQKKVYLIDMIKENINFNANVNLLIDKLIYQMGGVITNEKSN